MKLYQRLYCFSSSKYSTTTKLEKIDKNTFVLEIYTKAILYLKTPKRNTLGSSNSLLGIYLGIIIIVL